MGKSWDSSGVAFQKETWEQCLRVLKPGGYLLAFGGSRTYHRIACAIEDAGFEIRDTIKWLYGSGFPKSMNLGLAVDKKNGVESIDTGVTSPNARPNCGKENTLYESGTVGKDFTIKKATNEWQGWGTCLKPAFEPIIVARKPFKGSLVDNVIKYGVGGINIDECRVATSDVRSSKGTLGWVTTKKVFNDGRFPANIITDGSDEVAKGFPYSKGMSSQNNFSNGHIYRGQSLQESSTSLSGYRDWYNDEGSAMRYFYCAKASKKDRDEGLDKFDDVNVYDGKHGQSWGYGNTEDDNFGDRVANVKRKNIHPTVKPTSLMQYLVRLVTPKGGTILDPFMGSGSTGKACLFENRERNADYKFIGIEMTNEYLPICKGRIDFALGYEYEDDVLEDKKEETNMIKKVELF